jgi:hypothetical protein
METIMKERLRFLFVLLALLCLFGCAKSDGDPDSDNIDMKGTWTGLLRSLESDGVTESIVLPSSVVIGDDGSTSLSWYIGGSPETYTGTCTTTESGYTISIRGTFDTHTSETSTPITDLGTLTSTGTLDSSGQIATGTYKLDYDSAAYADDTGDIKVTRAGNADIAGTWKGTWLSTGGFMDQISVVFKADGSFTVSGGSDYTVDISNGTWSLSGTSFTASSSGGSVVDTSPGGSTTTFLSGNYTAGLSGRCLISGTYSIGSASSGTATGSWSLGKVF